MEKMILGISGASGVIYGIRLLQVLNDINIESHLIVSKSAIKNIAIETEYTIDELYSMASVVYDVDDVGAAIASGSFRADGMIVAPCSIKSLSAIANSYNDNLIIRAADVTLKERRRLVLLVRETPLHEGHLELMIKVARIGGIIMPPIPAFYHLPQTINDLIDQTVGKALDLFSIDAHLFKRWETEESQEEERRMSQNTGVSP
ncbi:MAG: UbiX family flavin prenyltransferase [Syntrophorhabdaceae bacterium]|nr:UbiX family flavin prenyltransferase [Syntrophorhabdaceae bacterium]